MQSLTGLHAEDVLITLGSVDNFQPILSYKEISVLWNDTKSLVWVIKFTKL